jgi:hypothetical protein
MMFITSVVWMRDMYVGARLQRGAIGTYHTLLVCW